MQLLCPHVSRMKGLKLRTSITLSKHGAGLFFPRSGEVLGYPTWESEPLHPADRLPCRHMHAYGRRSAAFLKMTPLPTFWRRWWLRNVKPPPPPGPQKLSGAICEVMCVQHFSVAHKWGTMARRLRCRASSEPHLWLEVCRYACACLLSMATHAYACLHPNTPQACVCLGSGTSCRVMHCFSAEMELVLVEGGILVPGHCVLKKDPRSIPGQHCKVGAPPGQAPCTTRPSMCPPTDCDAQEECSGHSCPLASKASEIPMYLNRCVVPPPLRCPTNRQHHRTSPALKGLSEPKKKLRTLGQGDGACAHLRPNTARTCALLTLVFARAYNHRSSPNLLGIWAILERGWYLTK